jgi:inhibitor of cysteine peptidase
MSVFRSPRREVVPLLCLVALATAGCATIERDEVAAPANGGAVVMRTGTPLIVSLPADPSVGYGWVLQDSSPNLYLVGGPDYTPDPKPPGLVGVANTTSYRFRARAPGPAMLEFAWKSPPGESAAPMRTVRYDVTINPEFPAAIGEWLSPSTTGADRQPTVKYWFF